MTAAPSRPCRSWMISCLGLVLGLPLLPAQPTGPAETPALPPEARGLPFARRAAPEGMVGAIKFGELTIDAALERLEAWSGRTALRPNALPATTISLTIDRPMTRAEAREVLETVLSLNGIAVIPLGDKYLKVVPLATARTEAPPFLEGSTLDLPPSGQFASKVFHLQFLRVGEFMPQVASLLSPAAASPPLVFEKANAALITDTISNLQQLEVLIARLDQPMLAGIEPKFYKIRHSTASALVTRLQSLLGAATAAQLGTTTSYQADDRTNQVILLSDPRQHAFFDNLIAQLDSEGESSTRQEVIPLKHANATEMATLLSNLISGQNTAVSRSGAAQANQNLTNARNAAVATLNTLRAQAAATPAGGAAQGQGGNRAGAQGASPVASVGTAAPFIITASPPTGPGAPGETQQQFSTILTVVADERSNALVISGTVEDLRLLKALVSQLDVILAQVRIEVVIAEITLNDSFSSGIDALGLVIQADKLVGFSGGGPGFNIANGVLSRDANGRRDLAATLNLVTTPRRDNTNILSVPNIVTTHNKQASIFVGQSFPVITSYVNTGTTGGNVGTGYTSTVTYKNIGIQLTVTPLIGHDGSVQLEIQQQVDDVLSNVLIDGNSQPVIGSRTTESFVSAQSGEIVVLGGLQRKVRNTTGTRLGGIPVLGAILGSRKKDETRTDLVFFLRPYVLTNTAADNAETLRRLQDSPQQPDVEAALGGSLSPMKR